MPALDGVRIIDVSQGQQGPHASVLLSDLGAEVIKVEARQGEISRGISGVSTEGWLRINREAYQLAHNRNKLGVTIDLGKEKGRKVLYRLVSRADVFLENFRPGVAARLGIDYAKLKAYNPALVYAYASGYGTKGPRAGLAGLDLVGQAVSGIMEQTGAPDGAPTPVGAAIADQSGSILLALGIMVALYHRERTGQGQQVDISLLGAMMCLQSWEINYALLGGPPRCRGGRGHPLIAGLWNIFPARDGWLAIAGVNDERWPGFCRALGLGHLERDPRFATADARVANRAELLPLVDAVLAQRPRAEWLALLEAADAVAAPVNTHQDLAQDPQVAANGYLAPVEHPALGEVKTVAMPLKFSQTPALSPRMYPQVGEHTSEVLSSVGGYTWDEIAQLYKEEVI